MRNVGRFLVLGLAIGCGGGGESFSDEGPVTVRHVNTYVLESSQSDVALEWFDRQLTAFALADSGEFSELAITFDGGDAVIEDAPIGDVYLVGRLSPDPRVILVTSRRNVDWGKPTLGRAEMLSGSNTISLNITGLEAWEPNDELHMFSAGAAVFVPTLGFDFNGRPLDPGSTTAEYLTSVPPETRYIDASLGDVTHLAQFSEVESAGFTFKRSVRVGSPAGFTQGDPLGINLTEDTAPSSVALNWRATAVSQQIDMLPLAADTRFFSVSMFARPGPASFGNYGSSADLAFGFSDGLSDIASNVEFIDALPSDWARIGRLAGFARFDYNLSTGTPLTRFWHIDELSQLDGVSIEPRIGPPSNVRVDGADASVAFTTTLTPEISWDAPALGSPSHYEVTILAGTDVPSGLAARLYTTKTSVRIPPGIFLEAGFVVAFQIAAVDGNVDILSTPRRRSIPEFGATTTTATGSIP